MHVANAFAAVIKPMAIGIAQSNVGVMMAPCQSILKSYLNQAFFAVLLGTQYDNGSFELIKSGKLNWGV